MPYLEALFSIPQDDLDLAQLFFDSSGALGVWTEIPEPFDGDIADLPVYETETLHAYYLSEYEPEQYAAQFQHWLDEFAASSGLRLELTALRPVVEEDWAVKWQEGFPPREVGQRFLICAPWNHEQRPGRLTIVVEPGQAFGTGLHESTQDALALLEGVVRPGIRVLDAGCGSGVLALGAVLLGAEAAVGIDIDPHAVREAAQNAALSGIEPGRARFYLPETAEHLPHYDLYVANMLWKEHLQVFPQVLPRVDGTPMVLGGIANDLLPEARQWLHRHGYEITEHRASELFGALIARPISAQES